MSFNVGDLIAKIKLDTTGFKDGVKDANNSVSGFSKDTAIKAAAIGAAFVAVSLVVKKVATEIGALAEEGGKFQSVSDAFRGMSEGMGINGEELIASVKKASSGTITEMKVMQNFLKSSTLIGKEALGENGENFTRFATIAKKASRATGQDVDFLFESIVNGIGRTSVKWLDNTGVVINATDAYEKYAKEVGANTRVVTRSAKETQKLNDQIASNSSKLAIAEQRVKEFSDNTKESTKMSSESTLAKLRNAIATDKARLSQESWTETIKVSSEDLTEEQKKIAITNEFLGKAEKLYENVDASAGGYSSALGRSKVATDELRKAIGLKLIPTVQPMVEMWGSVTQALADVLAGKINLKDKLLEFGIDVEWLTWKIGEFKDSLIETLTEVRNWIGLKWDEHKDTILGVAEVLGVIFAPALIKVGVSALWSATVAIASFITSTIKMGVQAVITGAKMTVSLIARIITLGVQSSIAAIKGMASLIAATINFAYQGWKSIAMLIMQIIKIGIATAAWIFQTTIIIAQTVATTAATVATWLFNAALAVLTSPITLVIIAIGLLIAAVVWLIKNWDMVSEKGKEIWASVKNSWNGMLEDIKNVGGKLLEAIVKPFKDALGKAGEIANKIREKIAGAFDTEKRNSPSISDRLGMMKAKVTETLESINVPINSHNISTQVGNLAGAGVGGINIYMNGNIGSIGEAQSMGEAMGDQIINKLKQNVRF